MKLTSTFLTALAAAAISSRRARGAGSPRHQPGRHGPVRPGLPGLQPLRQRRMAQGQPDPRRPVLLGILHDPRGDQPREPAQGPREGLQGDQRARLRRPEGRRLLRRRAWTRPPSRRRASRRSRPSSPRSTRSPTVADAPGRDRAPPDDRRQRGLPLRLRPGPPERERGHRRRVPGRPRAARPRLLPKTDDDSKKIREQYVAHVTKMFELMGDDAAKAAANAKTVMDLETKLAEASMTRVERRDPGQDLQPQDAGRARAAHAELLLDGVPQGGQRSAASRRSTSASRSSSRPSTRSSPPTPLADWKTYLRWHLVHAAAPSLSKAFVDENFDFYDKTLQGTPENELRWKRCVTATDNAIGFALGKVVRRATTSRPRPRPAPTRWSRT